jgi:hypothetical protein
MQWFYLSETPGDPHPYSENCVSLHKWFNIDDQAMLVSVYATGIEGKVCLAIEANVGKDQQETEMQMLSDDEPIFWKIASLPPQIQYEVALALARAFKILIENRPDLAGAAIIQCVDIFGEAQSFPIDYDRQNLYGLL